MTKRANSQRGEHELVLAGKRYRLRPSISALAAIEEETGKSVIALVRLSGIGELSIKQLGIIGAELIRAGADQADSMTRAVNPEKIAELIFEEGLPQAQAKFSICLLDAAQGGRKSTGEAKAAPDRPAAS
jgi:hypothetical protein